MDDRIRQRIEEIKQRRVNINVGDIFSKSWEIFSGIALYAILAIVITFAISFMINFFFIIHHKIFSTRSNTKKRFI